ncbi:MAG: carboxypeptidase-like regulatory domain-containing protein [Bacteroidota bacterium]|mgnify:CR=1 FL=1
MKKLLAWLMISGGIVLPSMAQVGSIRGKVTDEKGQALPGATVRILDSSLGAITNTDGTYQIPNVASGSYALEASSVGYEQQTRRLTLKVRQTAVWNAQLSASVTGMEEVVVVGESEASVMKRSANSIEVVSLQKAVVCSADLGQVLAQTKGVSVQRSGGLGSSIRLSLNGLTDDQIR